MAQIAADLGQAHPALRLVQGDVGSGKTVVAAMAALQSLESEHQVALMAPTELLAEQHMRSFRAWLEPLGVDCAWLTGRQKGRERNATLQSIGDGSVRVAVGTHALFQEGVRFRHLGFVVVDEQHRFGVLQRVALLEKGEAPHVLAMSATPMPRPTSVLCVCATSRHSFSSAVRSMTAPPKMFGSGTLSDPSEP